jgi:hypothetical protein
MPPNENESKKQGTAEKAVTLKIDAGGGLSSPLSRTRECR